MHGVWILWRRCAKPSQNWRRNPRNWSKCWTKVRRYIFAFQRLMSFQVTDVLIVAGLVHICHDWWECLVCGAFCQFKWRWWQLLVQCKKYLGFNSCGDKDVQWFNVFSMQIDPHIQMWFAVTIILPQFLHALRFQWGRGSEHSHQWFLFYACHLTFFLRHQARSLQVILCVPCLVSFAKI